ncbi:MULTISPECIES: GmrSD restriction endonuclease domain-containing protein [Brevibacillus]|uniref:GmrSD restriction endonuclease domain-containing protein n=1 Tax=Brevibacillus TaxID=55080 RepID=UPI0030D19518
MESFSINGQIRYNDIKICGVINLNITPRGMSVMNLYQLYRNKSLLVNRKYQRKLVWTKEEKESLIDSVLSQYPIPLILLAEKGINQIGETTYEIIDGMQRLNALFSFIENQFSVNGSFFDVSQHPTANTLAKEGVFTPVHGDEIKRLNQKQCAAFLEYQLPISTFQGTEREVIEVFGRINSNGKHLSPQEVRQAGTTTVFSELVRELSSEIRGDVSREILPLTEMPEISIDSKNIALGYGVAAEDTFWCNQGILRVSQLRDSEDEQLIADIILSIALKEPFQASKDNFDDYYLNDRKKLEIETAIATYGKENLRNDIKLVFDTIQGMVISKSLEKNYLKNILNPSAGSNAVKEPYYSLFMATYQLIIVDQKEPFNIDQIFVSLSNLASRLASAKSIVTSNRIANINLTVGLIQPYFKDAIHSSRSAGVLAIDFENFLRLSKVEPPHYDFKQGFYTLDNKSRRFDEDSFEKILHNICAMANLGKGRRGWIFIGVSDREAHTLRIEQIDNVVAPRVGDFGVVGLEREAKLKGVSLDQYFSFITTKLTNSDLPDSLKANITSRLSPINYRGSMVIMIEVLCGDEPSWYKDEMYVRDGAQCKKVQGADVASVFSRFK